MFQPSRAHEYDARSQGYRFVAGIDEVGRGALAGPVAAAAVILPWDTHDSWLDSVRDSKQLSPSKREYLSKLIWNTAVAVSVGMVPSEAIDAIGIVEATRLAMSKAVDQLSYPPDFLLIDALAIPNLAFPQQSIIHGDRLSLSIACASIVAKVARDQYMVRMDDVYPGYDLACHKGYGTKRHLLSLQRLGPSLIHRQTFNPVRQVSGLSER